MRIGLNTRRIWYYGFPSFEQPNGIKVRAVNMLGSINYMELFSRRGESLVKNTTLQLKAFDGFIRSRRLYGISEKTLRSNEFYLVGFRISSNKVNDISELTPEHLGLCQHLSSTPLPLSTVQFAPWGSPLSVWRKTAGEGLIYVVPH